MRIDLVKIWPIYREEKGVEKDLGECIDDLLNFVLSDLREELEEKLWEKIVSEYGKGFLEDVLKLQELFLDEGNYDSDLEPVIGLLYFWREIFSGIVWVLPDNIFSIIKNNKDFIERGVFGDFLRKSLVNVTHDKYPLSLFFGIEIREVSDIC